MFKATTISLMSLTRAEQFSIPLSSSSRRLAHCSFDTRTEREVRSTAPTSGGWGVLYAGSETLMSPSPESFMVERRTEPRVPRTEQGWALFTPRAVAPAELPGRVRSGPNPRGSGSANREEEEEGVAAGIKSGFRNLKNITFIPNFIFYHVSFLLYIYVSRQRKLCHRFT